MKRKPKTIGGWLKTLPKELYEEALADKDSAWDDIKSSLSEAITCGIVWDRLASGYEFWEQFYLAVKWAETEDAKDLEGRK